MRQSELSKIDDNKNTCGISKLEPLHPSLLLQVQNSINTLYVPVRFKQNLSSPAIPGSPIYAQLL